MSVPKLFSCRFVSFWVTSMTRRVNIWQRDFSPSNNRLGLHIFHPQVFYMHIALQL